MSNYYKGVPASTKPDLNRRVYFCLDASGGYYKCLYHDGKWIADGSAQDVTEYITHYLQPIEPAEGGLTDDQIAKLIHRLIIDPTCDYEAELLANEIRDHYSLMLSAEKERQGELMAAFAEWCSINNWICVLTGGRWGKQDGVKVMEKTTAELINLFTQSKKT